MNKNVHKTSLSSLFLGLLLFSVLTLSGCAKLSDAISSYQNESKDADVGIELQSVDTDSETALKSIQAFKINLYPKLVKECSGCHANINSPRFAQDNVSMAYAVIFSESLVNLDSPAESRLVTKPLTSHKCVPRCGAISADFQAGIEAWIDAVGEEISVLPAVVDTVNTNVVTDNDNDSDGGVIVNLASAVHLNAFKTNLYPVLVEQCGNSACHGNDVPPKFAHSNVETAYSFVSAKSLVNLINPANSRLAQRPLEQHRCAPAEKCQTWSDNIVAGIKLWADEVADSISGAGISGANIMSKTMTLAEGVKDEGQGRVEDAVIAKYEFKTGEGTTAYDSSGVFPPLDLEFERNVTWLPGRGVELTDPDNQEDTRLLGSENASAKLYKKIAGPEGSQQYTIEAWIINASTALDGPARIVTYSGNAQNSNFTMGQDTDYYSFRNRSNKTGNTGSAPVLESNNNAGDLKTQLQHVVFTFDEENGRNIYVNGIKTAYEGVRSDPAVPALIGSWSNVYRFVLGNEYRAHRQWLGKILFVAIHNRALTEDEIVQNTLEGIGDRFILAFDVSALLDPSGVSSSTVRMVVSELDDFSYVFGEPTLLTSIPSPNIPVKNLRIAVNGNIPAAAQSFRNVNVTAIGPTTLLSPLGAVIPKDSGPETDRFSLVFEVLGNNSNVLVEPDPIPVEDNTVLDSLPENGVRTFAQLNNTMAVLTGVDPSATQESYLALEQQLPGTPTLDSFVTSNQVGIAKLSLDYCDILVEDPVLRTALYGDAFEFSSPVTVAFSDQAKRDIIINRTVDRFVGTELTTQPTLAEIQPDLDQLISQLSANCAVEADCDASRTKTIVKAVCTAVLASAAVSIN